MLFIRNIKNCEINTGPVSNSIMIHDSIDSTLSITGHQVKQNPYSLDKNS